MSFWPVQIRLAQLKPMGKPLLIRTEAIFDFDSLLGQERNWQFCRRKNQPKIEYKYLYTHESFD